ncbi:hypothetical protein [Actinomadura macrotermitis]|uniref:Uncharacterized protein n=1 Tax=Actinomadura macrotermitis TaxID=2585200 RepID=A0A7K0BQS8_9ACTN|nr:hypothetical protein [Actinomadura macrotermitis]MQY03519.1 hypothetical protein [Actinomadura macrotermitis]
MTTMPELGRSAPGAAIPAQGMRPRAIEENEMILLSQELSRVRIQDAEREAQLRQTMARVRALRRARRDAHTRAARVRRALLLAPQAVQPEVSVPRRAH